MPELTSIENSSQHVGAGGGTSSTYMNSGVLSNAFELLPRLTLCTTERDLPLALGHTTRASLVLHWPEQHREDAPHLRTQPSQLATCLTPN